MKKSKLLTPILSATGLIGVATLLMTTVSCNKATISELKVEIAKQGLTTDVELGDVVKKDDFKVTAIYSDKSEKEVKDYTCYGMTEDGYTFTEKGSTTLEFIYESKKASITFTVAYGSNLVFKYPVMLFSTGTVTFSPSGSGTYKTTYTPTIYSNGVKLKASDITLTAKDDGIVDIDNTTGAITAKTVGSTTITASLKTSNVKAECPIVVGDYYDNVTCYDNNTAYVAPKNVPTGDYAGTFILDNSLQVTKGETTENYKIIGLVGDSAEYTEAKKITNLYIPSSIQNIDESMFSSSDAKLYNVYYGGSQKDYELTELSDTWINDQVIGIECNDGMFEFERRIDTKKQTIEQSTEPALVTKEAVGRLFRRQTYTARFDFSKLDSTKLAKYKNIYAYNDLFASIANNVTYPAVYKNGVLLNEGTDYTQSGGILTLTNDPAQYDNIVVKFRTPLLDYDNVHLAAVYTE